MKLGTPLRNIHIKEIDAPIEAAKKNPETVAQEYYEAKGYAVERTSDATYLKEEGYTKLGMPDLLVTADIERFFVEVKDDNDTIRKEQVLWYRKYPNVRIVILFVKQTPYRKDGNLAYTSTGRPFKLIGT